MKLAKSFWILTSLMLWLTLATLIASFLIRLRAFNSMTELRRTNMPTSALQTSNALANIQSWIRISQIFQSGDFYSNPAWLRSSLSTLETIINSSSIPTEELSASCIECSETMQINLKISAELAAKGRIKEKAYERIVELQAKFQTEKAQEIKLHALVAKDFAELMSSAPLYQSKGESELLYYNNGPFRWLPLLDDSARDRGSSDGALAVENFSEKLEKLRSQSKTIIENYLSNSSKIDKSIQAISTLEKERSEIKLKIKGLLLDGLKEEFKIG